MTDSPGGSIARFQSLLMEMVAENGEQDGMIIETTQTREDQLVEDRIEFDGRVRKIFSTIAGPFALLRSSRDAKALTLYHETKALAILNSSVVLEAQDGPDPPQQAILEKRDCTGFLHSTCRLVNGEKCIILQFIDKAEPVVKTIPLEEVSKKGMLSLICIFHTHFVKDGEPNYALYFKSLDKQKNYYLVPTDHDEIVAKEVVVGGRKDEEISRNYLNFTGTYFNPGDN